MRDSIVLAGIAPHPQLLVPEVGGGCIEQVADSQCVLRQCPRLLINTTPEFSVLIPPHPPLALDGPYEYEPTAHLFDEQVVDAIARGDPSTVLNIDPDLRARAGECGYRSIVIALGSVGENLRDHQVLSYEGPFGVGYMVAVLLEMKTEIEN